MSLFKGSIHSDSLKMTTGLNIIFPDHSNDVDPVEKGEPNVLYLLHGLSGNADEWIRFSKIEYYAKKYNFIVIMPEVQRSFYCNTKYGINYFDYVAYELPKIVNKWFNIKPIKENTFIAGESMGGYGAVKIGLSCPDRFNAIASLSGVLDYNDFKNRILNNIYNEMTSKEIENLIDEVTPIDLVKNISDKNIHPRLIHTCGKQDFLLEANRRFDKVLSDVGYDHLYIEADGDHEWPYWDKAIQYAFMYFLKLDMKNTPIY